MTTLAEACAAALYLAGFIVTGRWAARQDPGRRWYGGPDLAGITAVAALWPLAWFLVGSYFALCWLFGIRKDDR